MTGGRGLEALCQPQHAHTVLALPGGGIGGYLVGVKGAEPALNVGGVPAGDQAAVLQGTQLQGRVGPGRDHLVEGVLQGHGVIVGSLVLRARGEGRQVTWRASRKKLEWASSYEAARALGSSLPSVSRLPSGKSLPLPALVSSSLQDTNWRSSISKRW